MHSLPEETLNEVDSGFEAGEELISLFLSFPALVEFEKAARIFKTTEVSFGIEKCHQVCLYLPTQEYGDNTTHPGNSEFHW